MRKNFGARGALVASMVIFGTLGLFTRKISVSSGELALYRAVMAAAVIGAALLISRQKLDLQAVKKELLLLLLSGAALGINWILLFEAYRYTTVSTATLSYYFAPVLVTVISPVLFWEKLTGKQVLCFVMSTIGLVLISVTGSLFGGGQDGRGILFGLSAAVFYATVVLLNKYIRGIAGLHRTFFQFLAAALVLTPYVLCTGGITLNALDGMGWICLAVVGLVHTGLAYCLYFGAVGRLPGQTAAILSYCDPLVAVILSVTVLGEPMTVWQTLGGFLILGFTLWGELPSRKKAEGSF